jgi:hypothetical protein
VTDGETGAGDEHDDEEDDELRARVERHASTLPRAASSSLECKFSYAYG